MDFREAYDMFIEYSLAKGHSQATATAYTQDAKAFQRFSVEKNVVQEVEQLDARVLRQYNVWLRGCGYALGSIKRKLDSLGSFFKFLENEEIIEKNPMRKVERPKVPEQLPRFLTQDEADLLLRSVNVSRCKSRLRDKALIILLLHTGLRRSEMMTLNWDNIDFKSGTLLVISGKGKKDRVVPMNSMVKEALWEYLHSRLPLINHALFINRYGNRIQKNNVKRILDRYTRAAGISKHVTSHLLRHTCATRLIEKDVDLVTVKEILGHASVETTQIYTHTSVKRMNEAVNRLIQ